MDKPYAVISFAGIHRRKTPPRLTPSATRFRRIIVRADDCYESTTSSTALSKTQADRLARFIDRVAPHVQTIFVSCYFGEGRSASAAIAIAAALGLPWKRFTEEPFAPNGHVISLLAQSLRALGYSGATPELAACDNIYWSQRIEERLELSDIVVPQ